MKKSELKSLIRESIRELVVESDDWGVRWSEFGTGGRLVKKEKFFSSEKERDSFTDKLEDKGNFNSFEAWTDPKPIRESGVITYRDAETGEENFNSKKEAIDFAKKKLSKWRFSSGAGFERNPFSKLKTGEYFIQDKKNGKWSVGWKA